MPGAGVLCLRPPTFCEPSDAAHRRAAAPRAGRKVRGFWRAGAGSRKRSAAWWMRAVEPRPRVQRAVHKQMATKRYGLVSANTRGSPKWAELAFEIHGVTGGQRIEAYKGLQVLKSAGGQAEAVGDEVRSDKFGLTRMRRLIHMVPNPDGEIQWPMSRNSRPMRRRGATSISPSSSTRRRQGPADPRGRAPLGDGIRRWYTGRADVPG